MRSEYTEEVIDAKQEQARLLFHEHRKSDPAIVAVYVVPGGDDLRMVEVSRSVSTSGEIIPFGFGARPDHGLNLDTVLVLVNEEEYRLLEEGELHLPDGWGEVDKLTEIRLEDLKDLAG